MKCLVVVDMQNDFITGPLGTDEAQKILPRVIQKVKEFKGYIYHTMDTHDETLYLDSQEGKLLPVKHCIENTQGWLYPDELFGAYPEYWRDSAFKKSTFGSQSLAVWLNHLTKSKEYETVEEVILVGVCTDICVISNAILLKTYLPEVKITVDASCCAGTTPEAHENALKAMKQCQINIENWTGLCEHCSKTQCSSKEQYKAECPHFVEYLSGGKIITAKSSLEPCPFCGCDDINLEQIPMDKYTEELTHSEEGMWYNCWCNNCLASSGKHLTQDEAEQEWNLRAEKELTNNNVV